jgi:hypothetical protein
MLPLYGDPKLNSKQARQNLANCKGWPGLELQKQWEQLQQLQLKSSLDCPSLHLQVEAEAKAGYYRLCCNDQWKLKSEGFGHAYMTQDMKKNQSYR